MRKLGSVSRRVETIVQSAGNFFMIVITILVFAEVVTRYFGQSHGFMEEFSKWSQIWFVYLMLGVVEKGRGHIAVDILPRRLPERYKTGLLIFFDIVTLTFAILLFWSGVGVCQRLIQMGVTSGTGIPFPLWIAWLCMPLGAIFLAFFSIEHLVRDIPSLVKYPRDKE